MEAIINSRFDSKDNIILEILSDKFKADREIVYEAIKKNPRSLQFAAAELKQDPKLIKFSRNMELVNKQRVNF